MPLPLVGAHAVLEGMPEFTKNADIMNSKIGDIHNKLGGMGGVAQKAGGLVSGALKAMAVGTVGAVASIGAVGGGIVKLAYDAANLPGIQSVFTNMTKSMGVDADALMGKMREASYGAVKDFDLMKSANKAMVGAGGEFGKMFAESLPTLMKVSREAAKAQGLSVEYMYDSIVTGVKRMSPMILDNLGFQFSLTEANEKYAQSVGKTSKELNKEEKQMALLNAVLKSGQELIDSTGGHIDSIQKQYQSWQTAVKNIKDQIGIALLPVLQKFMDILGQPNQGMQDAVIRVTKSFVDWLLPVIDKVSLAISTLLNGPVAMLIRGFVGIGTSGVRTLADSIGAIFSGDFTGGFKDFGATITKMLTPALGPELAKKIGDGAAKIADAIQTAFGPIRDIVGNVVDAVKGKLELLQGAFNVLVMGIKQYFGGEKAEGIQKILMGVRAAIVTVFGPETYNAIAKFVGWMKIAADFVVKYSDEIIGALKGVAAFLVGKEVLGAFSGLAKIAGGALGGVGKAALGLLSPMGLVVGGAALLGVAWQKNWFGIQEKTAQVIDTIKKIIGGLGTDLGGGVFDWNSILPPNLAGVMKTVSGVIVGIRDTIQGGDFPWEDVLPPNLAKIAYDIVGAIEKVTNTIGPLIDSIGKAVGKLFAGDSLGALETLLEGFSNAFGMDAVVGVINFGTMVNDVFTQVQTIVTDVFNTVVAAVEGAWPTIQSIVSQVGELIDNVFNTVLEVAQAVWPNIQSIITTVWGAVSEVLNIFMTTIWPVLLAGFQGLLAWVNDNWPAIQSVIVTVFEVVSGIISKVVSEVIPFVIETFRGLVDWVKENWPAIQETISVVMEFIGNLIQIVLQNIQQFWSEHGANIMNIIQLTWDWIKTTIETIINIVKEIITAVMATITGDWGAAWEAIKNIVTLAWDWIKKTVETAVKLLGDVIAVGWGVIKTGVQIAWDFIKLYIETAWNNIKKNVESALTSVGKIISNEMDRIKKNWTDIWDSMGQIVKNAWNGILDWVGNGLNKAIGMLNGLIDAANKIPGVKIGSIGYVNVDAFKLAEGGILSRPTFVAGEAGTEVVAPLRSLMKMISTSLESTITDLAYRNANYPYSGPQPSITNNYGGDTYIREYNLTTQSMVRPGGLVMEFRAMELAHA